MSQTKRARWELLLLIVIFFAPLLAAYLFYFGPESWRPNMRTEHGLLIDPARPMPAGPWSAVLNEKWTLVHLSAGECATSCSERLWQTRQVREALHRRRERVQRLLLRPADAGKLDPELRAAHPGLQVLAIAPDQETLLRDFLGPMPGRNPILLVDPLGNWLMVYEDDVPMRGMHRDLKRLLRTSQIG